MKPIAALKLYSFIIVMMISFSFAGSAYSQIIYTNIPDSRVCAGSCGRGGIAVGGFSIGSSFFLSLDNGTADFKIYALIDGPWPCPSLFLKIIPLNGNSINANNNLPYALRKNAVISSSSAWSEDTCTMVTLCPCMYSGCMTDTIGEWTSNKEAFVGLKIIRGSKTHFAWVRLYVSYYSSSFMSCIIEDYAYENIPGQLIKAGATKTSGGPNPNHAGTMPDLVNTIWEESPGAAELNVFPNPVQSISTISFRLEKEETILLNVYDIAGQLIKTVAGKPFEKGKHHLPLDATKMNAGIYLLRMQTGSSIQIKKLVVVK